MQTRSVGLALPWLLWGAAPLALVTLVPGAAVAQDVRMEDLKRAPSSRQVESVRYCGGRYTVTLRDGSSRDFGERDLRFATDSGPLGPMAGTPVIVPAGRAGDRAIVIFVEPGELRSAIRIAC